MSILFETTSPDKTSFCFIGIPKTGCKSINAYIRMTHHVLAFKGSGLTKLHGHLSLDQTCARLPYHTSIPLNEITFFIIKRDPVDRLVSFYKWLHRQGPAERAGGLKHYSGPHSKGSPIPQFDDYISWFIDEAPTAVRRHDPNRPYHEFVKNPAGVKLIEVPWEKDVIQAVHRMICAESGQPPCVVPSHNRNAISKDEGWFFKWGVDRSDTAVIDKITKWELGDLK